MLGVEITTDVSVSQHLQRLVTASAQIIYALRVLRSCGLNNVALQQVYRATVVARLHDVRSQRTARFLGGF